MANAIKPLYATSASLTISLGGLASSTGGLTARQSTLVDNSTTRYSRIHLYPKIKHGTTPTANKFVYFWLLKGDGTNRTDGAGATDAALTIKNAELLGAATNNSATTGETVQPHFVIDNPGLEWGVAVGHDAVAALDATNGNHTIRWTGEMPEVQ